MRKNKAIGTVGKEKGVCGECGSEFLRTASKMEGLCPECAHILYGYEGCGHVFEGGKCVKCLWDGSVSEYAAGLKNGGDVQR